MDINRPAIDLGRIAAIDKIQPETPFLKSLCAEDREKWFRGFMGMTAGCAAALVGIDKAETIFKEVLELFPQLRRGQD